MDSFSASHLKVEDAHKWSYISEGCKHVVFAWDCSCDCDHSFYQDRVLRIPKSYFLAAATPDATLSTKNPMKKIMDFQRYLKHDLGLCSLIDLPSHTVMASCSFLMHLLENMLQKHSCRVQFSRLQVWKKIRSRFSENNDKKFISFEITIQRNYTTSLATCIIPQKVPKYNSCLSIELKPKAGYTSYSPFVHPKHWKIKFHHTRFEILQKLMQKNVIKKSWNSSQSSCDDSSVSFHPSSYSPLDLFNCTDDFDVTNRNNECLSKALHALFDNPQVNLKCWYKSGNLGPAQPIYGHHNSKIFQDESLLMEISHFLFPSTIYNFRTPVKKEHIRSALIQILRQTLIQEREALLKIRHIQQNYDLLDADGAIYLYNILVHNHCEGSHESAQSLINNQHHNSLPPDCHVLKEILTEIQTFRKSLEALKKAQEQNDMHNDWMTVSHKKVAELAGQLSKDSCVWLLKNWLLSLAMCDVSIFMTYKPVVGLGRYISTKDNSPKTQTESEPGIVDIPIQYESLACTTGQSTNDCYVKLYYSMKLVDVDPKPPSKLMKREKQEILIKHFEDY